MRGARVKELASYAGLHGKSMKVLKREWKNRNKPRPEKPSKTHHFGARRTRRGQTIGQHRP